MDLASAGSSSSDQGQREAFLDELSQFLSDRGRYLCRSPNLAGRVIDLHDLYNKVTSTGGYQKVTERGFWEDFLDVYGYPSVSTTLAYGLQRIYQLYLEEYERVHYFGDDEPQPFQRSFQGGHRRYRGNVSAHQRTQANMNTIKPKISNYDRVVYSLESCLPNEVDFAVNACTLLSGESRHVLKLPQCKRIIDALLLHAGIVSGGHDSYREVLQELQSKTKHDYIKFWKYSIPKKSVLPILLPGQYSQSSRHSQSGSECRLRTTDLEENMDNGAANLKRSVHRRLENVSDSHNACGEDLRRGEDEKDTSWMELFHGDRSLGVEDYEGQRVLQIALVLLNLSFEDFNVTLLARHPSLVCFVFLCIHSEYSCLRQTGLDILSNISSHMQLLHFDYDIIMMMFETINSTILSNDKFERVRGFEILGNICRPRPNLDYVCAHVSDEVYDAAIQNLMVTDAELLVATIEALYRLSKLGEHTCTKMIFVKGCTNILIRLVTLNVRIFGPEKLSEIKLAKKIIPGQTQHQRSTQQPQQSYQIPPTPSSHIQHAIAARPVIIHQQQSKFGSVQQSQPTIAAVVPSHLPSANQVVISARSNSINSSPPQPVTKLVQTPINHQIVVQHQAEASQVPQAVVKSSNLPVIQDSKPAVVVAPKEVSPPSPVSTPPSEPPTTRNLSPPGVRPTYTHPETGTIPPVFHYMPAPPNNIVQDNSPESFTKLWIWATYELNSESYIPRVDVYCEYLASSNRYGRQGKAEILSATDFGKCLKQIFPFASSRLFNQGRGQPQYHIAGIRKRATLLPVPGYQLKNTSSVFSSEQEYEKIPVTTRPASKAVSSKASQPITTQVSTVSVPIQQLQFQPVLIVSTTLGSSNLAIVSGDSTSNSSGVCQAEAVATMAVCSAPITLPVSAGASICSVSLHSNAIESTVAQTTEMATEPATIKQNKTKSEGIDNNERTTVLENSHAECESTPPTTTSEVTKVTIHSTQNPLDTVKPSGVDQPDAKAELETGATDGMITENGKPDLTADRACKNIPSDKSNTEATIEKDTSSVDSSETDSTTIFNGPTSISSNSNTQNDRTGVSNGFLKRQDEWNSSDVTLPSTIIDSQELDRSTGKLIQSQSKSTESDTSKTIEHAPLLNGYLDNNSKFGELNFTGSNGKNVVSIVNGETENAVNSILETTNPDMDNSMKMDVDQAEHMHSKTVSAEKCKVESELTSNSNHTNHKDSNSKSSNMEHSEKNIVVEAINDSAAKKCEGNVTGEKISETDGINIVTEHPSDSKTAATVDSTPVTNNVERPTTPIQVTSNAFDNSITTTPSNPIPHSALNKRLKETITRRRSANATPTSIPTNNLPPSVLQQYSYKQDGLAQRIINVAPQQLQQQQFHAYRPPTNVIATQATLVTQAVVQIGKKRAATNPIDAASIKVPRLTNPPILSTSVTNVPHQIQVQHALPRHPGHTLAHQPQLHIPPTSGTPMSPNPQGHQGKPKGPSIDLMAPNASLLVLYRNVGKIPFTDYTDEKEDAVTMSVRLTASLILKNLAKYSNLGRSMVQPHEEALACVAMSHMDCSPVVAKLLGELNV